MAALRRPPVAAAIFAAVAVLALASGAPALSPPTAPLALAASFDPSGVQFGDELTATVTILLDRDAVRPETLRLAHGLGPLTQLGPARTSRTVSGRLETVSVRVPVACLTDPCVAHAGATAVSLPRVRASAALRSGGVDSVTAAWPRLLVRSRVAPTDLAAARPPFAADTAPGAPGFRLPPGTLALALDALAAACAAGAAALLGLQLAARRRRRPPEAGQLERALRLVQEAERRPPPDRRRALGLLARLLGGREDGLDRTADDLAWSEPGPEGERLRDLLARIERSRQP